MKDFINSTLAIFLKDIRSEFRTRYAISAVMLFILTTITMIIFGTAGETLSTGISAGILWVIMFFSAMTGLSKSFVSEEERGTAFLLKLVSGSSAIYNGKLLFNIVLTLSINFLAVLLFFIFVNSVEIRLPLIFVITIFLGSIGIAGATTIISAIIAKANTKNALFPVLSFPVILPLILVGIETTKISFEGIAASSATSNFIVIISYSGIVITTSILLFDMVWND